MRRLSRPPRSDAVLCVHCRHRHKRRPRLDDTGNEEAVDKFFADAMAKSLLLDWMMQLALHNTGLRTLYEVMKHYQKYETADISPLVTQDVLLMAGAEDHYIPVHQLPDQIAHPDACAPADRAFIHATGAGAEPRSSGNFGLAFRVILDWMESLGMIEGPTHSGPLLALSATSLRRTRMCRYWSNNGHRSARALNALVVNDPAAALCDSSTLRLRKVHSISSSAMESTSGRTSIPSARAVCRLMANSSLVSCDTGRSAGFAPLRTLPL